MKSIIPLIILHQFFNCKRTNSRELESKLGWVGKEGQLHLKSAVFNTPWLLSIGLVYVSLGPANTTSGVSTWILFFVSCVSFVTPVDGAFSRWLKQNLSW